MEPLTNQATRLHYDLRLDLDPLSQFIAVSASLVYHAHENRIERVRFYLHHQLRIESLSGRRVLGYHLERNPDPPLPDFLSNHAAQLDIYFDPPLSTGETALIQFQYQGNVAEWPDNSSNIYTSEWVELGMQFPWYPLMFDGAPTNLTFSLQVSAPHGYKVASHGRSTSQADATYFNWPHPTNDIVVVSSPHLHSQTFESETNRVYLHSVTLSQSAVQRLAEDLLWTLDRFAGWFGPIRPSEFTLIESPRASGAGYARRGLTVLSALNEHEFLEQQDPYLHNLAKEAAHAWWGSAPLNTWDAWLNESFAEYSAMMVIRERFGQSTFDHLLNHKRERGVDISPLWEFDRQDSPTLEAKQTVEDHFYHQGPLLLHKLAERVGNRRFLDLCRGMQWGGVQDSGHFLDLLEELEGQSTRDWMEATLKQR